MISTYHTSQKTTPYRSTVALHSWLKSLGCFQEGETILDVCCGAGGPTHYLAEQEPECSFVGIDRDTELIADSEELPNLKFVVGDALGLTRTFQRRFKGIVSFQTLSWLPNCEEPLIAMAAMNPDWIGLSSLFYDGPLHSINRVEDKETGRQMFYNVYSLPYVRSFLEKLGYEHFSFVPFEIDIELGKPQKPGLGTYTEKTVSGKTLQISGPMLMPWYFIHARR